MKTLIGILLVGLAAHGEGKEAGGGNAVVCFNSPGLATNVRANNNLIPDNYLNNITFIETLDLYLAKKKRGLTNPINPVVIDSPADEDHLAYAEKIAKRFEYSAVGISNFIRQGVQRFPDVRITMEPKGVPFTPDSALVGQIDNLNCVIATMAFQYNTSREDSSYYLHVDSRLFNHPKHSHLSQNVLFLHEVAYTFDRSRQVDACQSRQEGKEACLDRVNSRNTQIMVGYWIRTLPVVTLKQMSQEMTNLSYGGSLLGATYPNVLLQQKLREWLENARRRGLDEAATSDEAKAFLADVEALRTRSFKFSEDYRYNEIGCRPYTIFMCDFSSSSKLLAKLRDSYDPRRREYRELDQLSKDHEAMGVRHKNVKDRALEKLLTEFSQAMEEIINRLSMSVGMPEGQIYVHAERLRQWPPKAIEIVKAQTDTPFLLNYLPWADMMPELDLNYPIP